jgi:hypothetical protein
MGDINQNQIESDESTQWIDEKLRSNVDWETKVCLGRAVFTMAQQLRAAGHPKDAVVSVYLDLQLVNYLDDDSTVENGLEVLDQYMDDMFGQQPKKFFQELCSVSKPTLKDVSMKLSELMEVTLAEGNDASVEHLLTNTWGLGAATATLLATANARGKKTAGTIVFMELYLLVVLRFMELKFGIVPNKDDAEEGGNGDFVTHADLTALQDNILTSLKDMLLQMNPALAKSMLGKQVHSKKSREVEIQDSDGDSSGEDSSDSDDESNGELDSSDERAKISKGLNKLHGKAKGLGTFKGESRVMSGVVSRGGAADYLFSNAPVPKSVLMGPSEGKATFYRGTLRAVYNAAVATWGKKHNEVMMGTIMQMVVSEYGMFLIDIRGWPHTFKTSATKKRDPVLHCSLFNPDGDATLAALSMQAVSVNLFPLTDELFDRNIEDQRDKAMEHSFIVFKHSPAVRAKHIGQFGRKVRQLRQTHLWNRSSIANTQANPYHITTWCVILLFYTNIWMKAMTRKDTSILVEEFDMIWQSFYANRLLHGEPPNVSMENTLKLLEYRHDKCKTRGTSSVYCPICSVEESRTKATTGGQTVAAGFYAGLNAWKKTVKEGGDKTEATYLKLHPNLKKFAAGEKTVGSSSALSGYQAHVARQHLILLHDSYEL